MAFAVTRRQGETAADASCVLGDPNALRFGTRLRTCVRENSPPDYFPCRTQPSQASTPHRMKNDRLA